mmetsp:Transcript_53526/g.127595  ORF Transcript_53526/g.127595 Transcript_53526/m.127595 type:complete len:240 (-) Transcript_53526:71-790(-)
MARTYPAPRHMSWCMAKPRPRGDELDACAPMMVWSTLLFLITRWQSSIGIIEDLRRCLVLASTVLSIVVAVEGFRFHRRFGTKDLEECAEQLNEKCVQYAKELARAGLQMAANFCQHMLTEMASAFHIWAGYLAKLCCSSCWCCWQSVLALIAGNDSEGEVDAVRQRTCSNLKVDVCEAKMNPSDKDPDYLSPRCPEPWSATREKRRNKQSSAEDAHAAEAWYTGCCCIARTTLADTTP